MRPIEFTFEACDKRGVLHTYGINMNLALSKGFTDKLTAVQIAFGFIRPLDNELDFSEAIYIGTQSDELRGFFYDLLKLGVTDKTYEFLLDDHQPFDECWADDGGYNHLIDLYNDGTCYCYQHIMYDRPTQFKVIENSKHSSYVNAVSHFLEEYEVSLMKFYPHISPLKRMRLCPCRFDNAWELSVPINEEL